MCSSRASACSSTSRRSSAIPSRAGRLAQSGRFQRGCRWEHFTPRPGPAARDVEYDAILLTYPVLFASAGDFPLRHLHGQHDGRDSACFPEWARSTRERKRAIAAERDTFLAARFVAVMGEQARSRRSRITSASPGGARRRLVDVARNPGRGPETPREPSRHGSLRRDVVRAERRRDADRGMAARRARRPFSASTDRRAEGIAAERAAALQ